MRSDLIFVVVVCRQSCSYARIRLQGHHCRVSFEYLSQLEWGLASLQRVAGGVWGADSPVSSIVAHPKCQGVHPRGREEEGDDRDVALHSRPVQRGRARL